MEIGGYFELERFGNRAYYKDLYALNLGRTALTWLLKGLECKTLYVPWLLCDSVTDRCTADGITLVHYHVDQNLVPLLYDKLPKGAYLYLVNYYGQLTDDKILSYREMYERIIVDHTHAFFQHPLPEVPTLYSCRKFFGVSDGAYLSVHGDMPPLFEQDVSMKRMEHLLGRLEENASAYYHILHQNASAFATERVKWMSRLTKQILDGIDYDGVRKKRNNNYKVLDKRLGVRNPLDFVKNDGPLAYPFYHPKGKLLRKALGERKIYVPTYWGNVIETMPQDSVEYDYAANILAVPCDQRYGDAQMEFVADNILDLLNGLE